LAWVQLHFATLGLVLGFIITILLGLNLRLVFAYIYQ